MQTIVGLNIQENQGSTKEFSHKEYHYFALEDVKVGDLVIVKTANGLRIAKVSSILNSSDYASSYIVQKIDIEQYEIKIKKQIDKANMKAALDLKIQKSKEKDFYEKFIGHEDSEISSLAEAYIKNI